MKPICVPCQRFYRCERNGVYFIEGMPIENGALSGTAEPKKWRPYKLWSGDRWKCHGCGHILISGVGANPISERHYPEFAQDIEAFNATFQVNDC